MQADPDRGMAPEDEVVVLLQGIAGLLRAVAHVEALTPLPGEILTPALFLLAERVERAERLLTRCLAPTASGGR